jgi:hypothetical protein
MIAVMGRDANPADMRIVVDPNSMNPAGTKAIDWYQVRVAFCVLSGPVRRFGWLSAESRRRDV